MARAQGKSAGWKREDLQSGRGPGMTVAAIGKAEPKSRCFSPGKLASKQLRVGMAGIAGSLQQRGLFLLGGHPGCPKSSCARPLHP